MAIVISIEIDHTESGEMDINVTRSDAAEGVCSCEALMSEILLKAIQHIEPMIKKEFNQRKRRGNNNVH